MAKMWFEIEETDAATVVRLDAGVPGRGIRFACYASTEDVLAVMRDVSRRADKLRGRGMKAKRRREVAVEELTQLNERAKR